MIVYFAGNSDKFRIRTLIRYRVAKLFSYYCIVTKDMAFGEEDRFKDYIRAIKRDRGYKKK